MLVAVISVYAPALHNEFSKMDDYDYIVTYGHFNRPLTTAGITRLFTRPSHETIHDYYRPVYNLIRCIDFRIWKTNPMGYRLTNILFYYLACCCVLMIALRLLPRPTTALLAAVLFALHPAHVEAVTWIMAGGYPISLFFLCLSFLAYLRYRDQGAPARWLWLSSASYLVAALANPPAIILPAVVILYEAILPPGSAGSKRTLGVTALAGIMAVVVYLNFIVFPAPYISRDLRDSFSAALTAIYNMGYYASMLALPVGLHTPREFVVESAADPGFIAAVIFLLACAILFLRGMRRGSRAAFFIGWFYVCLAPSLTLWKADTTMSERYALYGSLGFALLCALGFERLQALAALKWPGRRRAVLLPAAAAVLVIAGYAALTVQRNLIWNTTETLLTDTLRKNPGNMFASMTLATYYTETRRQPRTAISVLDPAIAHHEALLAKARDEKNKYAERFRLVQLRNTLGDAYRALDDLVTAMREHRTAIALVPDYGKAYFGLASDFDRQAELAFQSGDRTAGRTAVEEALAHYEESIRRDPRSDISFNNAAVALFELGRFEKAELYLRRAVSMSPGNYKAIGMLAQVSIRLGKYDLGEKLFMRAYRQAAERGDGLVASHLAAQIRSLRPANNRVNSQEADPRANADAPADEQRVTGKFTALFRSGDYPAALRIAQEQYRASRMIPWLNNMGLTYYRMKEFAQAEAIFKQVIARDAAYELAYRNLGLVYARQGRNREAIAVLRSAYKLRPDEAVQARIRALEEGMRE